MPIVVETGTWTGSGSTPQTISLADSGLTPVAIVCWMVRQGAAAAGFVAHQALSIGFGTRRGGSTQSGCVGLWSADAANPSSCGRVRNTTLLQVLSSETTSDYTVSLDSFGAGQFVVSYSSAANASGDVFAYLVIGGLDDAIVLNETMASQGATEAVTGAGFQGNALLCLDSSLSTTGTLTSNIAVSFGCATSSTQFWSVAVAETDGDTMTSTMNWTKAARTDACLERLTINGDTSDARWDLDTFDSDGFTLGVVDAPTATNQIATFLVLKGGAFEAGSHNKATATGDDTFTLTDSSLGVEGVLLACIRAATGITTADTTLCLGAGTTANTTRGSAVNQCVGITGPEAISTTADRFSATDSVIEELTGGASPAETSEAWFDTKSTGSFIIDWAVNGGSSNPIFYLAIGNAVLTPLPSTEYPDYINAALALFTASHLAYTGPVEPPLEPVPDQFPTSFPERIVRPSYAAAQQPYTTGISPQPERDAPFWVVEFPDRIVRHAYLAAEQMPWTFGNEPIVPPFVQDTELVHYPDRVERPRFAPPEQLFTTALSPQPERDAPIWSVAFPDRIERPAFPAREQAYAPLLAPQPERTTALAAVEFPARIERRFYPTTAQLPFALGEPTFVPPAPDQFPTAYPDRPRRTAYAAHAQQAVAFGQPPIVAAFVQDTGLVSYPESVARPAFSVFEQLSVTAIPAQPERTSPLAAVVTPDVVRRPAFPAREQLAIVGSPEPERPAPLADVNYPNAIPRSTFRVTLQLSGVVGLEPPAPAPDQFPTQYPDSIVRWSYPAHMQQAQALGQPPIVVVGSVGIAASTTVLVPIASSSSVLVPIASSKTTIT